jgi:hypothetical protein
VSQGGAGGDPLRGLDGRAGAQNDAGGAGSVYAGAGAGAGAGADARRPADAEPAAGSAGDIQDGGEPANCVGTLAQAAEALGFSCPQEFCVAEAMAADCSALPAGVIKTSTTSCATELAALSISFELSPTRGKICYYASKAIDGIPPLVAAVAWSDQASFCGGSALQIAGGDATADCGDSLTSILCDLAHPEQNQPAAGTPAPACFNAFSHSCAACCPTTLDCPGNPDNYPDFICSSPANTFCSCSCQQETWHCCGA